MKKGNQSVTEDTKVRRVDDCNNENILSDNWNDLLRLLMVKVCIASSKEKAATLPDVNRMLTKRNHKVKVASELPNWPWKLAYAIPNTRAGPNIIRQDAMDPSWGAAINVVKPQGLRPAQSTPLRVIRSIRLATQSGQRVKSTSFLVVENLAVDIILDAAFIDAIVKLISSGKQMIYPINHSSVAMKGTDHESCSVTQMNDMATHPICCRAVKLVKILAMSQVPALVRAPVAELQVVESHPHLMRRKLAMVTRGLWDVTLNSPFPLQVPNWSRTAIALPKSMIIAKCTALRPICGPDHYMVKI